MVTFFGTVGQWRHVPNDLAPIFRLCKDNYWASLYYSGQFWALANMFDTPTLKKLQWNFLTNDLIWSASRHRPSKKFMYFIAGVISTSKFINIALADNLTLHPLWNIVTCSKINMIAAKKLMLKVQVHGRYKPCLRSAKARQMFSCSFHGSVSGVFFTLLKWSHTDFPFNYYLNIAGSSCLNDSVCLWFTKWLSPHCVKILFPFLWQTERSKLAWQRNTE